MILSFLSRAVKPAETEAQHPQRWFWFSLSLTFALMYSLVALKTAFGAEYVVNDDARQHVFWMRQFLDPALFPNDLIVDYFKSISPWGYTAFYQFFMQFGLDPIWLHKVIPVGLALVMTLYCYGATVQILPIPAAGFVASLLLNQLIWVEDHVPSGTSRAFVYPLLLAVLYYLLRRSWLGCWVAIALLGAIYPSANLLVAGILVLYPLNWKQGRVFFSRQWQDYVGCLGGLIVVGLGLLPLLLEHSPYAPLVSAEQARQMPEFGLKGRTEFFNPNPWRFWIDSSRSGINPPAFPVTQWVSVALPWLLRRPDRFPLAGRVNDNIRVLGQVLIASFAWFMAAHALLFTLYLPNRYTNHSLRIVMAIAAGIATVLIVEALLRRIATQTMKPWPIYLVMVLLLLMPLANGRFGNRGYVQGLETTVYEFFLQQPKDIRIASIAMEARSIPTFAQRSILISREHAIPYHLGYYEPFRQRILDTVDAQYTSDPTELQRYTDQYGVDYWLLDRTAFGPDYLYLNWVSQYSAFVEAISARMLSGDRPYLEQTLDDCTVVEGIEVIVVDAACAIKSE